MNTQTRLFFFRKCVKYIWFWRPHLGVEACGSATALPHSLFKTVDITAIPEFSGNFRFTDQLKMVFTKLKNPRFHKSYSPLTAPEFLGGKVGVATTGVTNNLINRKILRTFCFQRLNVSIQFSRQKEINSRVENEVNCQHRLLVNYMSEIRFHHFEEDNKNFSKCTKNSQTGKLISNNHFDSGTNIKHCRRNCNIILQDKLQMKVILLLGRNQVFHI